MIDLIVLEAAVDRLIEERLDGLAVVGAAGWSTGLPGNPDADGAGRGRPSEVNLAAHRLDLQVADLAQDEDRPGRRAGPGGDSVPDAEDCKADRFPGQVRRVGALGRIDLGDQDAIGGVRRQTLALADD